MLPIHRSAPAWTGLLVLLLATTGCGAPPESSTSIQVTAEPPALDWVGGKVCAECHPDEAGRWSGSHHDLAMQEADESTVLGDFDGATFTYAGETTTFSRDGDEFRVRTAGPDGAPDDYRVAYTFGVEPLQQYLIETGDGRLQALSVCWDTRPAADGGQRWFHLYPGEEVDHRDVLHWTGPLQNWNFMCAECHSTGVVKGYDAAGDRYATTFTEIDVSCEACHGPGSRHVAWAADGIGEEPGLAVDLDRELGVWLFTDGPSAKRSSPPGERTEIELCARCHARRAELADFGSRHGRPLTDTHRVALLDEGLYHADGQIDDEVYVYGSFLQSRMYREGVTCGDCHDPHTAELRAEGNSMCAVCHLPGVFDTPEHHFHPAGGPGARCVDCHMRAKNYMVVDPRRDHSFRVPRPDLSVEIGTPNACDDCHAERGAAWAAARVAEWYGPDRADEFHYGEALHAGRSWQAGGGDLLRRTVEDRELPGIARASALELLPRYPGPLTAAVIEGAALDPDPLVRRAAAGLLEVFDPAARWRWGAPLLSDPIRTVRLAAARGLTGAPAPDDGSSARLAAALEEYRDVQRYNSDRSEAQLNLGWLALSSGDPAAAEAAYRRAIEREPRFAPAYANLADLYREQGREAEAEALLRGGLEQVPAAADLHHALGLTLVRRQRLAEALPALARAAGLRPGLPRYAYVHGVGLYSAGEQDAGLAVLAEAHERFPAEREILAALVSFHRERGERQTADEYVRRLVELAPDDSRNPP